MRTLTQGTAAIASNAKTVLHNVMLKLVLYSYVQYISQADYIHSLASASLSKYRDMRAGGNLKQLPIFIRIL